MTEQEINKKRIVAILSGFKVTGYDEKNNELFKKDIPKELIENIADVLIAEGLCFMNKHRIFVENAPIPTTCVDDTFFLVPNTPPTIKQLYGDEEVEQIVRERDEYKHRAEVAERALRRKCESEADSTCPYDEKSERCKECSEKRLCSTEYATQCFYEKALQQAEKELREERKDE